MSDTAVYVGGIQVCSREASSPQLLLFCCQQKCSTNCKPFCLKYLLNATFLKKKSQYLIMLQNGSLYHNGGPPSLIFELVIWSSHALQRHVLHLHHTHTPVERPFFRDEPGKPVPERILLKQETVSGSGINWAICKSASRSRQITTPASHHSVFYRLDAFPATQPTASKH